MADKSTRARPKPDGHAPPVIDGQLVENEILLALPAKGWAAAGGFGGKEVVFPHAAGL